MSNKPRPLQLVRWALMLEADGKWYVKGQRYCVGTHHRHRVFAHWDITRPSRDRTERRYCMTDVGPVILMDRGSIIMPEESADTP